MDWRELTRWERADLLYRHVRDCKARAKMIREGMQGKFKLKGVLQALVTKILGF